MKIYLASSWRNQYQADVLAALRVSGAEVYDFKNPARAVRRSRWLRKRRQSRRHGRRGRWPSRSAA